MTDQVPTPSEVVDKAKAAVDQASVASNAEVQKFGPAVAVAFKKYWWVLVAVLAALAYATFQGRM